jgi:hypothetical protein
LTPRSLTVAWCDSALLEAGIANTPVTILENTCMASTASSAGYATGNMLVTAIPAMLLLSATEANPTQSDARVEGTAKGGPPPAGETPS